MRKNTVANPRTQELNMPTAGMGGNERRESLNATGNLDQK